MLDRTPLAQYLQYMKKTNTSPVTDTSNFQLKGGLFTLTVLYLLKPDLAELTTQLGALVKQTPKLFQRMPIVLDLHRLQPPSTTLDFKELSQCLSDQGLILIGVRAGNAQHHEAAVSAGLAIMPNTKAAEPAETPAADSKPAKESAPVSTQASPAKIITQPVRSGQQIYARNGDLIILAPVSPGAELIADGNIHVYGTLFGRALAGVNGNLNARIFCQKLDAELVSIAGHYWISEDLHNNPVKENIHIYLENDRLQVGTF